MDGWVGWVRARSTRLAPSVRSEALRSAGEVPISKDDWSARTLGVSPAESGQCTSSSPAGRRRPPTALDAYMCGAWNAR